MKRTKLLITSLLAGMIIITTSSCSQDDGKLKIGILQYATHSALSSAREGFIKKLAERGYGEDEVTYIIRNPEGDASTLQQSAAYLESQKLDLVFAIATPSAIALKNAYDSTDNTRPILFSAVTDAVDAGLVASNEHPGGNITGTSDMNPVAEQIELLKEVNPSIQKIGILYTASENNSKIQSDLAVAKCTELGITSEVMTTDGSTNLATNASALISRVDALYLPTDNIVAANMNTVTQAVVDSGKHIPICVGEKGMVEAGGVVTLALDYTVLGEQTGDMAADIFEDKNKVGDIPVSMQENFALVVNLTAASTLGVTVPSSIIDRADEVIGA